MNKDLIKSRFSKKLGLYNENAKVQLQMAEVLSSKLDKTFYANVLEIGCGTGLLTQNIQNKIMFESYVANDIVDGCKEYISKINSKITFNNSDIEKFLEEDNAFYDLIISNATFQWIENLEEFIKKLVSKLTPNGMILFSTFGVENFREIQYVSGMSLKYHSVNELKELFREYSVEVDEEVRIVTFDSPIEVLKHIKNTGVNSLQNLFWTKGDLKHFEKAYNSLCPRKTTLTYNPVYIKIKK